MLSPEERVRAVEILVDHYVNKAQAPQAIIVPTSKIT